MTQGLYRKTPPGSKGDPESILTTKDGTKGYWSDLYLGGLRVRNGVFGQTYYDGAELV